MSEILLRTVREHNSYCQKISNATFDVISKLNKKSPFWYRYNNFLTDVQIPLEILCINILKNLKQYYIHIPLVKKIVNHEFNLHLNKEVNDNETQFSVEACFMNLIETKNDSFYVRFWIELYTESILYGFDIFSNEDDDQILHLFTKNCQNFEQDSMELLEENLFLNQFCPMTEKYFGIRCLPTEDFINIVDMEEFVYILNSGDLYNICLIYGGQKIDIKQNDIIFSDSEYLGSRIFKGFKDFLVLSLLATSENTMNEINYIWNNKNTEKNTTLIENLIEETNIEETELTQYIKTLKRKKHIIFKGSPGTGKTYLAKHIAKHLSSEKNGFYELIQFHPSYSYEDFIQGIRPQTSTDGNLSYSMIPGRFLTFCEKAKDCEGMCILIIDEINRANLSQVFGELMYLLEYREEEIQLAGSDEKFKIPDNVYIIGTMNTADRSIALVDHALRRRFAFIPIKPNYDILRKYHQKHNESYDIESLINILKELNTTINDRHYEIGVSFFLTETLPDDLEDIWTMEIEPYLEEYFFDEIDKIDQFRWIKIKDKLNF